MAPKREFVDPPEHLAAKVQAICGAFPEIEVKGWSSGGTRWRIRGGTFASLVCEVIGGEAITAVTFHARGADLDALLHVGHPFYPGWGGGLVAMVLDEDTDWAEVAEVLTDSYCLLAPKKLVALISATDL